MNIRELAERYCIRISAYERTRFNKVPIKIYTIVKNQIEADFVSIINFAHIKGYLPKKATKYGYYIYTTRQVFQYVKKNKSRVTFSINKKAKFSPIRKIADYRKMNEKIPSIKRRVKHEQ